MSNWIKASQMKPLLYTLVWCTDGDGHVWLGQCELDDKKEHVWTHACGHIYTRNDIIESECEPSLWYVYAWHALPQVVIRRDKQEKEKEKGKKIPVTKWYVWNDNDCGWKYNHYEEGHSDSGTPISNDVKVMGVWAKADWLGKHAYMQDGVIL